MIKMCVCFGFVTPAAASSLEMMVGCARAKTEPFSRASLVIAQGKV